MSEVFKKLSDREHILARPGMYLGSIVPTECKRFINGTLKSVVIVPGLVKITNELIDNSIDEYIRSKFTAAKNIKITIDKFSMTIEDDGRGIPVEKYDGEWRPQVAWCEAKAGTSFEAHRVGPGANGVGSFIANTFSKQFIGETCDGNYLCRVTCTDNMENVSTIVKKSSIKGTKVYIEPDFNRFGIQEYTQDHIDVIKERIISLSATYPDIKFVFNDEVFQFKKQKSFLNIYGTTYVSYDTENMFFGIYPTDCDEYVHRTSIDGLDMILGGTHESYISREISYALRDIIKKKHKLDFSPAEVKRGLKLVLIGRFFPNMEFESQTKERLTNSEKTVKQWLGDINFEKLAKQIFNTQEIIDPIIQAKLAKQLAADKRAVTIAQKKINSAKIKGYIKPQSNIIEETSLFIVEGLSAATGPINNRNPHTQGVFPIRGVPMNTYNATNKEIVDNKELKGILGITGLSLESDSIDNLQVGKIIIATDGDCDGYHIRSLLFTFFSKWKKLFTENKIYVLNVPIIVATKGKTRKFFTTLDEYDKVKNELKGYQIRYIKGIGGYRNEEISEIMTDESFLEVVELDEDYYFDVMCGTDANLRKEFISKD